MGISVVICCYNSSGRLPGTLEHLAQQKTDQGIEWEVIVVDNASTDNTIPVAKSEWEKLGTPATIKIISESKQGLSFAREAGIKAAKYEFVVFCDDDNMLAPDYLQKAHTIMISDHKIGACGGKGTAVFEGTHPGWFEQYELVFACGSQSPYEGYLGWDVPAMYGAGLVVRRDVIMKLYDKGYHFLLSGRSGKKLSAGEDHELLIIMRLLGYSLYYSPELQFEHFMPKERMNRNYLKKIVYGSARSSAVIFIYADVTRYILTGKSRYKVNWFKDILKAVNAARSIELKNISDLQTRWARLSGGLYSVLSNVFNYRKYKKQIEQLPELFK